MEATEDWTNVHETSWMVSEIDNVDLKTDQLG